MFRSYYTNAIPDLFPSDQKALLVTENGIPFYQIVPFGSKIDQSLVSSIKKIPYVVNAIPALFLRSADVENVSAFSDTIMGIPLSSITPYEGIISKSYLLAGRFPAEGYREVCIGNEVENGSLTINDSLVIDQQKYTIVGILKPSNILFDHIVLVELSIIQYQFDYENIVSCIFTYLSKAANVTVIKESIQNLDSDLQVVTSDDITNLSSGMMTITTITNIFFGVFIVAMSLLFTILLMIKKYQIQDQEIQTLWELGTPSTRILSAYTVESCIVSICGFFIGTLTGFILFFETMYNRSNLSPYFINILDATINSVDLNLILELFLFSFVSTILALVYLPFKIFKPKHSRSPC